MKKATFNIRRTSGKLLQKEGYIFRLPYPKRVLFAVTKEGNTINSSLRWVVTEMSSGYACGFGQWDGTRKATIAQVQKALHRIGAKKIQEYIKEAIKLHNGTAN